jgi:hypothetical protein
MPILIVFALTASCLPAPWPAPPFGLGPAGSTALMAVAVIVPLSAAAALRRWAVRTVRRDPSRHTEVEYTYGRTRRLLFFVNVGAATLAVIGLGWGHTVRNTFLVTRGSERLLAPYAELAVPLPYFLILFGCWLTYFDAERALHRATARGDRPFWTRAGYFFQHLRQLVLLVGLPVGLFVTQQTLTRFAPQTTSADWYKAASFAVAPLLLLVFPLLVKPLLGLKTMPAGPVRDRFEALAKRLDFRCRDFLLWPTHGAVANAMIVGLVPRVRYVVFTDRILEEMPADELDAVLGHEIGHAKHGHIWLYMVFLVLSISVLAAGSLNVAKQLDDAQVQIPAEYEGWLVLPPVFAAAAYIFVVFGFLSRRCERQADVFGCKAVSCANPSCEGHDADTVYPVGGKSLCPTGIRTFARGLERVGLVNGVNGADFGPPRVTLRGLLRGLFAWVRAWQHFTMPRRVAFLMSLLEDPKREARFQRRVTLLRWGLLLGLAVLLVALGEAVGWKALAQVM